MKKLFLVGIITILVVSGIVGLALAGGGPGPGGGGPNGCYVYYMDVTQNPNFGSVTTLNPGEGLSFAILTNCPVTVSNTWNDETVMVTQEHIDGGGTVVMDFTTSPDQAPSADHYINAIFPGSPTVYRYIRVVIGDPEPHELLLAPGVGNPRWASYADYQSRELTVDYWISNVGANNAYHVRITGASATNGVIPRSCSEIDYADCIPAYVYDFLPGGATSPTNSLKFTVPSGVDRFRVTFYASALDYNWREHTYPSGSAPPEA